MFSSDPGVWYVSGYWAWISTLFFFIGATISMGGFFAPFVAGAAFALIIWMAWPFIGIELIEHRAVYQWFSEDLK